MVAFQIAFLLIGIDRLRPTVQRAAIEQTHRKPASCVCIALVCTLLQFGEELGRAGIGRG